MPVTRKLTTVTNPFRTSARIIHLQPVVQDRMDRYSSKEYLLLQENGTLMDDSLLFSGTSGRVDGWMYGWTYGWMDSWTDGHIDG